MPCRSPRFVFLLAFLSASAPRAVLARCDTVANASALADARKAIDAACPCASAATASAHIKCAKPVVASRIENGLLTKACKGEALKHATKSICGRPGAAVCCRVKTNGKTSHKITKSAAACTDTPTLTTCVSTYETIDYGCDAVGCVPPPVCGNYVVEPGETCEPPDGILCDASCHLIPCDPPVSSCGNGTVDAGEDCEPPGVGACGWTCHTTTCAGSGPGEIAIACASSGATVGAGSRGSDYLLAWSDLAYRPQSDMVARRFDPNGAAVDATAKFVSAGVQCASDESLPAVGADANGYVIAWYGAGLDFGFPYYAAAYARPYGADASLGPLDELIRVHPFGMCQANALWSDGGRARADRGRPHVRGDVDGRGRLLRRRPDLQDPERSAARLRDEPAGADDARPRLRLQFFPPCTLVRRRGESRDPGTIPSPSWHAHIPELEPAVLLRGLRLRELARGRRDDTNFNLCSRAPASATASTERWRPRTTSARRLGGRSATPDRHPCNAVAPAAAAPRPDGGVLLGERRERERVAGPVVAFDGTVWLVAGPKPRPAATISVRSRSRPTAPSSTRARGSSPRASATPRPRSRRRRTAARSSCTSARTGARRRPSAARSWAMKAITWIIQSLVALFALAESAHASDACPASYPHPARAPLVEASLLQAFVCCSCASGGGHAPNTTTEARTELRTRRDLQPAVRIAAARLALGTARAGLAQSQGREEVCSSDRATR